MFPWEEGYNPYAKAIELSMNYEHGKITFGQNSIGYFRQELLDRNIYTTFDAIKAGLRTATTRNEKYNSGTSSISRTSYTETTDNNKGPSPRRC